jgi:hypothetical protein
VAERAREAAREQVALDHDRPLPPPAAPRLLRFLSLLLYRWRRRRLHLDLGRPLGLSGRLLHGCLRQRRRRGRRRGGGGARVHGAWGWLVVAAGWGRRRSLGRRDGGEEEQQEGKCVRDGVR